MSEPRPALERFALRGVRVLVVEDEPDVRDLVAELLRAHGAEVHEVGSSAEALPALEELVPDVLVSDIGMPGDDGYTLMRRVRERSASRGGGVPAVALTAYAREEDRRSALDAGYQRHLAKPVSPTELVETIRELARR